MSAVFSNAAMVFLSIVFESAPFILMGAIFSSLVLIFIPENFFKKYLPANPLLSIFPALILSAVFPVCECAIIPAIRGLVRKGMPLCAGAVFLAAAPILNPIVLASTFYAFRFDLQVVFLRFGLAGLVALSVGILVYFLLERGKPSRVDLPMAPAPRPRGWLSLSVWKNVLDHSIDEFFSVGKYFILGAAIASLFQSVLSQQAVLGLSDSVYTASGVMMFLAYILSLCSTADAFVAASFSGTFPVMSVVAFLLLGPMLDIKNTTMLLGYFSPRFALVFILAAASTVYAWVIIFQFLLFS
ncbi:MAG: permease [Desulfonatronovibrionaceae bacterium]